MGPVSERSVTIWSPLLSLCHVSCADVTHINNNTRSIWFKGGEHVPDFEHTPLLPAHHRSVWGAVRLHVHVPHGRAPQDPAPGLLPLPVGVQTVPDAWDWLPPSVPQIDSSEYSVFSKPFMEQLALLHFTYVLSHPVLGVYAC